MIIDEFKVSRIEDFIISLSKKIDNDILMVKKRSLSMNVPVIRDDTRRILEYLVKIKKPKVILEIGTGIGYSTIVLNKSYNESIIYTVENFDKRIKEAKKIFEKYDKYNKIKLFEMDALEFLKKNRKKFDLIFLDGAKGQYIFYLPYLKKFLKKNGILITDNVFKNFEIVESKFLIEKRDRTIHKRVREFLYNICNDEDLSTYIFNIGDGMSFSVRIK